MSASANIDTVVKVGGALLTHPRALESVLLALQTAAPHHRLLVIPGGGPFADAVRAVDRDVGLDPDTAHWMAILGMEQYALLLISRMSIARRVEHPSEIDKVHQAHELPVLAPSRWLKQEDPLPHSWDVTSDSIAAWVSGRLGAKRLILVKLTTGEPTAALVDPYFERVLPKQLRVIITDATAVASALQDV